MYGEFGYKGAWNAARYHNPDEVPVLPPGSPTIKAGSSNTPSTS